MKELTAVVKSVDQGYDSDKEQAKRLLAIGAKHKVIDVSMGQSHTTITLEGFSGGFNTVNFEFFIDGQPHDIFADPDYNPYINGLRGYVNQD